MSWWAKWKAARAAKKDNKKLECITEEILSSSVLYHVTEEGKDQDYEFKKGVYLVREAMDLFLDKRHTVSKVIWKVDAISPKITTKDKELDNIEKTPVKDLKDMWFYLVKFSYQTRIGKSKYKINEKERTMICRIDITDKDVDVEQILRNVPEEDFAEKNLFTIPANVERYNKFMKKMKTTNESEELGSNAETLASDSAQEARRLCQLSNSSENLPISLLILGLLCIMFFLWRRFLKASRPAKTPRVSIAMEYTLDMV